MREIMKDKDVKKEGMKSQFDYSDFWEDEEEDGVEKELKTFSKGESRNGLKGKYIKKKNNICR
jgi:hypothetical protein